MLPVSFLDFASCLIIERATVPEPRQNSFLSLLRPSGALGIFVSNPGLGLQASSHGFKSRAVLALPTHL